MGNYRLGFNRIYYQTGTFVSADITGYFWHPSGVKQPDFTFTFLDTGIYYLDYNFDHVGDWLGIFFEDGTKKESRVFKVELLSSIYLDGQPIL